MRREERLITKGQRLRSYIDTTNTETRTALDNLKAVIGSGEAGAIKAAVANVRRAERNLRNSAQLVYVDIPGGRPVGNVGALRGGRG